MTSITRPSTELNEDRPNVILFLPPGPLFPSRKPGKVVENGGAENGEDAATSLNHLGREGLPAQHVLASSTYSTVVTVNYRLDTASPIDTPTPEQSHDEHGGKTIPFYKYPTPTHDTLAGFDWILQNLQPAQLSVLGTHVGGSLALMLALTESKSLHAVGALEPVCDWVELDEYCTIPSENGSGPQHARSPRKSRDAGSIAPPDLVPLLQARESFFQTPERYFDAFASPILFLRSAGSFVPRMFPEYLTGPEYPIPVLKIAAEDDNKFDYWDISTPLYIDEVASVSDSESDSDLLTDPADVHKGIRRRKSLSRWPPFGLDYGLDGRSSPGKGIEALKMTLPWVRVFTQGADEFPSVSYGRGRYARRSRPQRVLELQAGEMVSVMRRACFWGRESGFANERVTLASTRSESWARDAGEWLENLVESPSDR
ncbi:hypothetical protein PHISP_02360 [Aspergillus sp. HF37]|nr:hypothetical protein PHISP_02360 [Aspergillus sp. HF37]